MRGGARRPHARRTRCTLSVRPRVPTKQMGLFQQPSRGPRRVAIYPEPRFLPCGDVAVSVELGEEISREVNARVLALEYLIGQKGLTGVVETVPTFRSLLVYYDPVVVGYDELVAALTALIPEARADVLPPARTVEIPCCYGGDLGFELDAAAAKIGLTPEEMARLHASADYYVYFVGFTPGLPYMTGMPERLTIPRL